MKTGKDFYKDVIVWVGLFMVLVIAPLYLATIGHDEESRGFWVEFGVGLGFVGLALMGLQFVLTARFRSVAVPFGLDELLHFHRQAGYVAYFFIIGHAVVLLLADSDYLSFLDPRVNAPRAFALMIVLITITALVAFTIWREKLHLDYEWWRFTHGIFALLVVFIGLAHILMVGFYITELWQKVLWTGLTGGAIFLLIYSRVIKPYQMKKVPYVVTGVEEETESVWNLELEADGHEGMKFKAGQFAWLTLGKSPYQLQQHPFTISSSAEERGRYEFTIKELGDFTSTIGSVEKGTRAYLEGPYGTFILNPDSNVGSVFIVGGIGITPVISMLRTIRDRGEDRELILLYGCPDIDSIAYREELEEMKHELNLELVYILENPPDNWEGETGFIDEEVLKRYLPEKFKTYEYFICGPEPMMDIVEPTLRDWKIPVYQIYSERFNIV